LYRYCIAYNNKLASWPTTYVTIAIIDLYCFKLAKLVTQNWDLILVGIGYSFLFCINMRHKIAVIGAGIIGLSTTFKILEDYPNVEVKTFYYPIKCNQYISAIKYISIIALML